VFLQGTAKKFYEKLFFPFFRNDVTGAIISCSETSDCICYSMKQATKFKKIEF